jgi:hypothetical protein
MHKKMISYKKSIIDKDISVRIISSEPLLGFNPKSSQLYTGIFFKANSFCFRNEHK